MLLPVLAEMLRVDRALEDFGRLLVRLEDLPPLVADEVDGFGVPLL